MHFIFNIIYRAGLTSRHDSRMRIKVIPESRIKMYSIQVVDIKYTKSAEKLLVVLQTKHISLYL